MEKIHLAEAEGFQNKEALLGAYRHLLTATQKNSQESRYQVGMAYLLILVGKEQRALRYLGKALQLDPQHEGALELQLSLRKLMNSSPEDDQRSRWLAFDSLPKPETEEGYLRLYDQVENFIQREFRSLMHAPVSVEISLDHSLVTAQQNFLLQLQSFESAVMNKIQFLVKECDTFNLEKALQPAQKLKTRLVQTLRIQGQFQELSVQIDEAHYDCHELVVLINRHAASAHFDPDVQARLDQIYDACDLIADQLDQLSEKMDIQPVKPAYNRLIKTVQGIQERLEDES